MFRNSCKVVQRTKKKKKAHTQIHKLFFKPKHIWMIMEPCVALKKKHMYLSHCLHELLQFYRPQLRLGQPERWFCVYFKFFLKMLFHRGCCHNKNIASNMGWTAAYSVNGRGAWFRGIPLPLLPAGFGVTLRPSPPCPLACLQMGPQKWGASLTY